MEHYNYNTERAKTDWELLQDCILDDNKTYGELLSDTFFKINDLIEIDDERERTEEEDFKLDDLYYFLDFLMQNAFQVKEFIEAVNKMPDKK